MQQLEGSGDREVPVVVLVDFNKKVCTHRLEIPRLFFSKIRMGTAIIHGDLQEKFLLFAELIFQSAEASMRKNDLSLKRFSSQVFHKAIMFMSLRRIPIGG